MRIEVVTIFPDFFGPFSEQGLVGKAVQREQVSLRCTTPRDFAHDVHRSVDDAPYGGGSGMLMTPRPLMEAIEAAESGQRLHRVLLTPQGRPFDQGCARELATKPGLVLVCGRYEGVDERVRRQMDAEISLGDFVLMGGEVAAQAVIEATVRLLPGVLGNAESIEEESHAAGLLEYPHYTRPAEFRGEAVPPVLLSGDHAAIARWRRGQALLRTKLRRPELLEARGMSEEERALLAEAESQA